MRLLTLLTSIALIPVLASPGVAAPVALTHRTSPGDEGDLVSPALAELAKRGFRTGAALSDEVDKQISRPGDTLESKDVLRWTALIDAGYQAFTRGDFEAAEVKLTEALAALRARPATVAREQSLRDFTARAHVGLMLARSRLGRADDANSVAADYLRDFPDRELSRRQYGPEPIDFLRRVREALDARPKSSLHVVVDDLTAVIFVNERYIGVGDVHVADLYAGEYRVFVQRGSAQGRVHLVSLAAGQNQELRIKWALDAALRTGAAPALLTGSVQAGLAAAADLGVLLGARQVALIGVREIEGRRALVGTLLDADSARATREAMVWLEPTTPGREQLRALGKFLADGKPLPGVEPLPRPAPASRAPAPRRSRRFGALKWLTLGAGVAAAGAGVTLLVIDGDGACDGPARCPERYSTSTAGYITLGGAAVALGAGIYMLLTDSRPAEHPIATIAPIPGGATLALTGVWP
ncbi:MAG: hypothetical protein IT370_04495 [Deltaproteobacteria bacterium]|nr:hypothetical protein [Deltaproteobacteria bacterium]